MTTCVQEAKVEAVKRAEAIGMDLPSYTDKDLLFSGNKSFLATAFEVDLEDDLTITDLNDSPCDIRPTEEVISIRDDVLRIFLERKTFLVSPHMYL